MVAHEVSTFRVFAMAVVTLFFSTTLVERSATAQELFELVRISADDYEQIEGIDVIRATDYGSFVLVELDSSSLAELRASEIPFDIATNPSALSFQGRNFGLSRALTTSVTSTTSDQAFFIVQLIGPAKSEWLIALEEAGVLPLQYCAPYAYLVRTTPEELAAAASFDFVRRTGFYEPSHRIATDLLEMEGVIENVSVTVYDDHIPGGTLERTIAAVENLGGEIVDASGSRAADPFAEVLFRLPASALGAVASLGDVAWLNFRAPFYPDEDEMSDQIIAGNFAPLNPGYPAWQGLTGVTGNGVTVAALDRGYDTGVDGTAHPDLSGRTIMVADSVGIPIDQNGHGTHVGGIIAANGSLGTMDASGFLMGLGVAPQATLVVRRRTIDSNQAQTRDAVINGAVASNHSYGLHAAGIGYQNVDRTYDMLVRDADQMTGAVAEPLIIVFSAGNSGASGPTKEPKNVITVGSTRNQRDGAGNPGFGNINTVSGSSSRGPAGDGRVFPVVSAPGANIISTRYSAAMSCATIAAGAPGADPTYSMCSGTSMAAPHVTGSIALITQWWRGFNGGANPSPAMAKALLVNGAVDMGTANIPNGAEGWGRVNLTNVVASGIPTQYVDQTTLFTDTGNMFSANWVPSDPSLPVKATLAWSDAPGPGGGGNPATLVNDLDLVVNESGTIYRGNVFAGGTSTPGGAADTIDNLENVFIQNPTAPFTLTVTASGINGDGVPYNGDASDQDFALVCSNCIVNSPPVCNANGPYVAECAGPATNVMLDGSGSSDPDGHALSFLWTGPFSGGSATGETPNVSFAGLGNFPVDLEVDDGFGGTAQCNTTVTVEDTTKPDITAPPDITAECESPMGTAVDLGMPVVTDVCDAMPMITNDAPAVFPLGTTMVTWTATDASGNSQTATQEVTIVDTTPPELTVSVSPDMLWPPNHEMVDITATVVATDICDASPAVTLISVTSDEPDNGRGDGNFPNDIVVVDPLTHLQLRAERSGGGDGRVYTITYQAEDGSGNTTLRSATVTVPKSRGK